MLPKITQHMTVPGAVGIGIRDAATARLVASVSDAVVIGSRLIQLIEASAGNAEQALRSVQDFMQEVRVSMDQN